MTIEEVHKSARDLASMIEALEKDLDTSVKSLQAQLADLLVFEVSKSMKVEAGAIKQTGNATVVSVIERTWDRVFNSLVKPVLKRLTEGYQKVMAEVRRYFTGMGLITEKASEVKRLETLLSARIGISPTGNLIKTGYLYRLGKSDAVRESLRNYVMTSINNEVNVYDFQRGFKGLINGTPDIDGALVRYYRQFAYDTFNQIAEWANLQTAKAAGLVFFIYEGSLIDTSRKFCEKRAGKVFHISETTDWVDDPDLPDKKTKGSYDPIIDRGRYNCRHMIRWITYELAVILRPDVVRFKIAA